MHILGKVRHGLMADDPALAEQLKVGMVFQNGALFDSLTVGQNVGFLLYEHTRLPPARIEVSCLLPCCRECCSISQCFHAAVTGQSGRLGLLPP